MILFITYIYLAFVANRSFGQETGYKTWLTYLPIEYRNLAREYGKFSKKFSVAGSSAILESATQELQTGFASILPTQSSVLPLTNEFNGGIMIGTIDELAGKGITIKQEVELTDEGFYINSDRTRVIVTGKTDTGVLYGVFHLLRFMQRRKRISNRDIIENPVIKVRMLNHWDNPGNVPEGRSSVERGYAGKSIFKWDDLEGNEQRYIDYARMLASLGINGSVINNVNTAKKGLEGWKLLTPEYLPKLAYLAGIFRRYGIKLYISVNFFSPVKIGGLADADPREAIVQRWWKNKADEIYGEIPDFGGYLVKADSEGEPGPNAYGLTHADGANLLARSLKPHGGIVMWRAFVYGHGNSNPDRSAQAYEMFKPLDGDFDDNAIVQIKIGPQDFQIREPTHPLFSAMPKTNQILEVQITQEYTGHSEHICFLVPQWKEALDFDTKALGYGTEVKKILSGEAFGYKHSGIVGVSNIGDDPNWTGHLLAQANLYGFGRLAWNPNLLSHKILKEWTRQTFGSNKKVRDVTSSILSASRKTYEDYTMSLGIGFMTNGGGDTPEGHFSPDPAKRQEYHRADRQGVGYDRTVDADSHSCFASQYQPAVYDTYKSLETCPEELLLFFHHLPYTYKLSSGKTIIQHIYDSHNEGVLQVEKFLSDWKSLEGLIDTERFEHVLNKIDGQIGYAKEWRDTMNAYFLKKSRIPDNSVNALAATHSSMSNMSYDQTVTVVALDGNGTTAYNASENNVTVLSLDTNDDRHK